MEKIIESLSPNFKVGRGGHKPEIIVLHIMAGTLEGTNSWFKNPASQVSAHYGIGLKGQKIRYVLEENTAWANGGVFKPTYKLYKPNVNPNLYSVSLENEGTDLAKAPATQLSTLVELIKDICGRYNIPIDRDHIIAHWEISTVNKVNCPSSDHSIMDKIVAMCKPIEEMVNIVVPKSKLAKITTYLLGL